MYFFQLYFGYREDNKPELGVVGGEIEHFMFEKNRACSKDCFHIFNILRNAPDNIKGTLKLDGSVSISLIIKL